MSFFLWVFLPLSIALSDAGVGFEEWMALHGKGYASQEELGHRRAVFEANNGRIERHNSDPDATYTMDHNAFSDLTAREWREIWLGRRVARRSDAPAGHKSPQAVAQPPSAPKAIDWREKSVVTSVKNQGRCGSCWAFSSTGAMESAHAIATGDLVSLSEQQLIDCEKSNLGCHGGLQPNSFRYAIDNGMSSESVYPYIQDREDEKHQCSFSPGEIAANFTDYHELDEGDEAGLLGAVGTVGPVAIDMDAGGDANFQFYKSGVFTSRSCTKMTDHAVLAVGYGQDEKGSGLDFWIVKNSWGKGWGLGGYFLIQRGVNMCGVAQYCSFPVV